MGFKSSFFKSFCFVFPLCAAQDGAEPSSNSYSASNLQRLSAYFPGKEIGPKSTGIYKAFAEVMGEHPVALPKMVSAFMFHSQAPKQVSWSAGGMGVSVYSCLPLSV